ncbi:MAG TPA: hypothetical protein VLA13_06530, partial [Massilibacterium sp.]|nr:hypothetical protein [Massilibacterium sp.]
ALPAYKNVITNGDGTNPNPLEIQDFRVAIPSDFISLEGIRKINLEEDANGNLTITSFASMTESTDLFYKSIRKKWDAPITPGTYDYSEFKQVNKITLSGTSGEATIGGPISRSILFSTDLSTTASAFVTLHADAYDAEGIVLTNEDEILIFTSKVSGTDFTPVTITNTSGNLTGTVSTSTSTDPVIVEGPQYVKPTEFLYQFKFDNGYIYTNFEEGFIELSYKAFVTDDHGFPMIPDDQRFIEAIKWSIIEQLDYKKWRVAEIPDKVYRHSEQQRDWYIASARSKADIPSVHKMEALKNMFLRSITKVNAYTYNCGRG